MSDPSPAAKTGSTASAGAGSAGPASPGTGAAVPAATPAAKTASALPLTLGLVVIALVAGVALGTLLLGPRLAASRHVAPVSTITPPDSEASESSQDAHDREDKTSVYRVENIILNPAGSEGSHFLMATVAIELHSSRAEDRLRGHEDEVRDRIIGVLEKQTLESLSEAGARDTLRRRISVAIAPFAGRVSPAHIYLPQFVIQ